MRQIAAARLPRGSPILRLMADEADRTPASARGPLRVACYGDVQGNRAAHRAIVAAIREERPDLVIFNGDALARLPLAHMPDLGPATWAVPFWPQYLRGYPAFSLLSLVPFPALVHRGARRFLPDRDPEGFAPFLDDTAPLRVADAIPYLFVPGNHDLYRRSDRADVARHFGAPAGALGREHPDALWFSTDVAGFRFVVLDTGSDIFLGRNRFPASGRQLRWLDATLADAGARGLPAIVALHLPPFSSAREDRPAPSIAHRIVRGVLDRHRVALVLSGHAHAYERIERPGPGGHPVTYVVSGGGGAPFHRLAPPRRRDPGSRVFVERTLHYVLLELDPHALRGRAIPVPRAPDLDRFEVALR